MKTKERTQELCADGYVWRGRFRLVNGQWELRELSARMARADSPPIDARTLRGIPGMLARCISAELERTD